jgi:hypothetical protein
MQMSNIFDPNDEPEDFSAGGEGFETKDALVVAVYSQITHDLALLNVQVVLDWLLSLDEDTLLHFLPQNNPVFKGTRPDLNWFGSVEYTLKNETFPDYLDQTIGRN